MPLKFPVTHYRPTRASDNEGGFTETLGSGQTVYGSLPLHNSKIVFICDMHEDVIVGDLIVSENASYRVQGKERVMGTRHSRFELERVERPIVP